LLKVYPRKIQIVPEPRIKKNDLLRDKLQSVFPPKNKEEKRKNRSTVSSLSRFSLLRFFA